MRARAPPPQTFSLLPATSLLHCSLKLLAGRIFYMWHLFLHLTFFLFIKKLKETMLGYGVGFLYVTSSATCYCSTLIITTIHKFNFYSSTINIVNWNVCFLRGYYEFGFTNVSFTILQMQWLLNILNTQSCNIIQIIYHCVSSSTFLSDVSQHYILNT